MQSTICPWCHSSLPNADSTQACTACGKLPHQTTPTIPTIVPSSETPDLDPDVGSHTPHIRIPLHHIGRVPFTFLYFALFRKVLLLLWPKWWSKRQLQKEETKRFTEHRVFSLTLDHLEDEKPSSGSLEDLASEENDLSQLRPNGQSTWQKVLEPSPKRQSYTYPPRPPVPEDERTRIGASPTPTLGEHLSFSSSTFLAFKRSTISRIKQTSPRTMFWVSTVILIIIVSVFGVANTFGHRQGTTALDSRPSIEITPDTVSIGATMTIEGHIFPPHASISFTLDHKIPLKDTKNSLFTQTDGDGHFIDTIIVSDDWTNGPHDITAEDSATHHLASSPFQVNGGKYLSLPHLHLETNSLDFGSGDPTTSTTKKLKLSNHGNGVITWQESTNQPWLLMTPTQGTFTRDIPQQVTLAVDRSKLPPNSYNAKVVFSSNGGTESLDVSMQVTPLKPEHNAVMQISPSVLSFTATDGSIRATPQQITITNYGGQAMNWSSSSDTSWLSVSPSSMTVAAGGFTTAQVSVATRNLLPGTYTGALTFTARNSVGGGNALHSPQQVVVSITITPPCTLAVGSPILNFSSAYLQPAPSPKTISVTATSSCSAPINWSASSNQGWLKVNNAHATTPGGLSVGIDVAGLTPNTYQGAITISSSTSIQTVLVTFVLGNAGSAAIFASPSALSFNSIAGQGDPPAQTVYLTNTGDGILDWQAKAISNLSGNWLQITPNSGRLSAHQSMGLTVTVTSSALPQPGSYSGIISLSGSNGAGQSAAGSPQSIPISYTLSPACTLQAPSSTGLNFSTGAGINPASQSFSIGVTGACNGAVTVTPTLTTSNGGNWLSIIPSSTEITPALPATFTAKVDVSTLAPSSYTATITLTGTVNGSAVAQGTQTTNVTLTVIPPPVLAVTPSSITINIPGSTSVPINLTNIGGGSLNWSATLQPGAPTFISLSAQSGSLAASATGSLNVLVNASAAASGTYQTGVTINAINAANGQPVGGSPTTIPITIIVAPPVMQVNTINPVSPPATGATISPQGVTITNSGGGILQWTASAPTQPWLLLSANSGNVTTGSSSTITFSIQASAVPASNSTDQVVITPSVGNPVTITIILTVPSPTPTPTPNATITPTSTATITPTSTATSASTPASRSTSTSRASATSRASVTPTSTSTSRSSATSTSTPISTPTSKASSTATPASRLYWYLKLARISLWWAWTSLVM